MPYTPEESMAALKAFYYRHGKRLWGEFGFKDAFNCKQDWYAESVLAIDQGTIAPMIENHRTGLLWRLFMSVPEIRAAVTSIGTGVKSHRPLEQGMIIYPNPFNPKTMITFTLAQDSSVSLKVYNVRGESAAILYDRERLPPGFYQCELGDLPAGIYFCRLKIDGQDFIGKVTCLK
ncbi:MAG: T9SS type A sorting domain-containing protein, partial [candidate division KSB1 bacterium]|nr:T9SS type A sorting domain-containing protein [candidate division KSB1 bacterium]